MSNSRKATNPTPIDIVDETNVSDEVFEGELLNEDGKPVVGKIRKFFTKNWKLLTVGGGALVAGVLLHGALNGSGTSCSTPMIDAEEESEPVAEIDDYIPTFIE